MKREGLFCIQTGKGSKVSIPIKSSVELEIYNRSGSPQSIGETWVQPGESIMVPMEVGLALLKNHAFKVKKPDMVWDNGDKLQVSRHMGLGDLIFLIAACYRFHQEYPAVEIWVDTQEQHDWLDWVPFVKRGICKDPKYVINTTNPTLIHTDRVNHSAEQLGIEHHDMRFPIDIPDSACPHDGFLAPGYFMFDPYSAGRGARSLLAETIDGVLSNAKNLDSRPIIFTDGERHNGQHERVLNWTGQTSINESWYMIKGSAGVITVDTGTAWMAAALGKPLLVFYTHSRPEETCNSCSNIMAVEPVVPCFPCGLPGAEYPCGGKFHCQNYYNWRIVHTRMKEFISHITEVGTTNGEDQ